MYSSPNDTQFLFPVRVNDPDRRFGKMLLEQFGGPNGELAAAVQYSIQGLRSADRARQELLFNIALEELRHLEIVGALATLHIRPSRFQSLVALRDPFVAISVGGGAHDAARFPWTRDYLTTTGDDAVDLQSNIAAESRVITVYEQVLGFTTDEGTRDVLKYLIAREAAHIAAFTVALDSLGKASSGLAHPAA